MSSSSTEVSIDGMTCPSCVYKVECEVGDIEGVTETRVSLDEKKGVFVYDPSRTDPDVILKTINGLGFSAKLK